jgi:NADH-quinone oxidoreductase subunit G
MHLDKQLPLGELIYLDRERCIQCGRCVRFQDEIAGDPVIAFYQRGRSMEIATFSKPGFASYFSGNTTDICPVGALTTSDFRFGARPWELNAAASICPHCPVGCNITFNTRREARKNGKEVIKRAMPRQNEAVNEIWICDKGRFGYHYAESDQRLTQPLVRQDGKLTPVTWEAAVEKVAAQIKTAGTALSVLAGGRLSNEDLFNLKQLAGRQGGQALLYTQMGGGDLTAQVGLGPGSNLSALGKGSAILVIACDLEEEAPIWSLRIRQAARRGASLIVANPRPTKLDKVAAHTLRYYYGEETQVIEGIIRESSSSEDAARRMEKRDSSVKVDDTTLPIHPLPVSDTTLDSQHSALINADNLVVFFGSEGLGLEGSQALAQACSRLLLETGHTGKPNNGLVGVWPNANIQGAWDLGFRPVEDLADQLAQSSVILAAAADPAGDDPALEKAFAAFSEGHDGKKGFLVVQELFMTRTAELADVVLPAQAFIEREGTYTSGERRVQRFYPAIPPLVGTRADFSIAATLGCALGKVLEDVSPMMVFAQLAAQTQDYADLSYLKLAESGPQHPVVGRSDLYYGGTIYDNHQGLGAQLKLRGVVPIAQPLTDTHPEISIAGREGEEQKEPTSQPVRHTDRLLAVPVTRLYDRGQTLTASTILEARLAKRALWINPGDAARLGLSQSVKVQLIVDGMSFDTDLILDETVPDGVALAPRSVGLPVNKPVEIELRK